MHQLATSATTTPVNQASINKQNFITGTNLLFQTWTALQLARQGQWGGHRSEEKYQWFISVLIELFSKQGSRLEQDDLADWLAGILDHEFSTVAEDDSCYEMAGQLLALYGQCTHGRTEMLESLKKSASNYQGIANAITKDDSDSEDDYSEEEDEEGSRNPIDLDKMAEDVIEGRVVIPEVTA